MEIQVELSQAEIEQLEGQHVCLKNDEVDVGGLVRTVVDGVETDKTGRTFSVELLETVGLKKSLTV